MWQAKFMSCIKNVNSDASPSIFLMSTCLLFIFLSRTGDVQGLFGLSATCRDII